MMIASIYPTFPAERLEIQLTVALFIINSLLFFTAGSDSSKIKIAMLVFLTLIEAACLTYYYLLTGTAGA